MLLTCQGHILVAMPHLWWGEGCRGAEGRHRRGELERCAQGRGGTESGCRSAMGYRLLNSTSGRQKERHCLSGARSCSDYSPLVGRGRVAGQRGGTGRELEGCAQGRGGHGAVAVLQWPYRLLNSHLWSTRRNVTVLVGHDLVVITHLWLGGVLLGRGRHRRGSWKGVQGPWGGTESGCRSAMGYRLLNSHLWSQEGTSLLLSGARSCSDYSPLVGRGRVAGQRGGTERGSWKGVPRAVGGHGERLPFCNGLQASEFPPLSSQEGTSLS